MSIFIGVISNVAFKMSSYYDDDYDYSSQTLSESFYFNPYYGFEQYNYDGNGSVVVTAAVYGNKFSSLSELLANNENLFDATVQNDTSDEIRNWQVIYVDIYSYGDFEIGGITLTALSKDDDGYNEIYSVSPKEYFSNTLMYAPVVPLIVSEDISDYTFEISTVDSDNSTETIEFDATYSQIKELADARASDESDESEDY
jgi:hypothetical protein